VLPQITLFNHKDNDIHITRFSWSEFVEQTSNAIIASPLKRSVGADCITGKSARQTYQFHEACNYESQASPKWAKDVYKNMIPVEVPFLEQYFALFDARFAQYFFGVTLEGDLLNPGSDWGLDWAWCGAAHEWNPTRPGCYLVPLVLDHDDDRQIKKNKKFFRQGKAAIEKYREHEIVGRWMNASAEWEQLIRGGKDLNEIEKSCRILLHLNDTEVFDVQTCANRGW
jgi:hypothetical protein